ncbi:MAG: hypothetical protein DMG21_06145 [Acidobacteria bacterium]|nr:MAG: hypothetical protein DMG21_06145 [Acidobacteriota bacterium]
MLPERLLTSSTSFFIASMTWAFEFSIAVRRSLMVVVSSLFNCALSAFTESWIVPTLFKV